MIGGALTIAATGGIAAVPILLGKFRVIYIKYCLLFFQK